MYITDSYLFFLLLSVPYYFYKNGISKISILIFLIFWQGLFASFGDTYDNLTKFTTVLYAIVFFNQGIFTHWIAQQKRLFFAFLLFTAVFWISYFFYGGNIITMGSLYFYKYGMIFVIFNGLLYFSRNHIAFIAIKDIILNVLLIQSLLSIVKLILYGFDTEAIVGSMAEKGAELAVVIPLVALIFFWIVKEGKFNGWDYIRMASFFMISLASGKRAPVFLFPVVILALNYIKQGKSLLTLAKYTPFAILILFLGMKLTPTLNPEGKIWGSFDPQHAIDYILIYNFGTSSYNEIISSNYQAKNRGGSLLFFLAPSDIGLNDLKHIAFGRGLYSVTSRELGRFETNFSAYVGVVEYQGLASSIIAIFFSLGYGGVLSLFLISLSILSMISRRQLYVLILCLFLWDFLLYANHMIFSAPSAFILVYLIIYAKLEDQKNSSQKQPKFVGGKFE